MPPANVLICVNVRDEQAWWKRLDTWFADPARRARRVFDFDKAAGASDVSAFSLLSAIAVPVGEAMPPVEGKRAARVEPTDGDRVRPADPVSIDAVPGTCRRLREDAEGPRPVQGQ